MTHEETLVACGAECVGGDLILKHEVVGQYRNGEFTTTLAGVVTLAKLEAAKQEEILAVVREAKVDQPAKPRGRRPAAAEDPEVDFKE